MATHKTVAAAFVAAQKSFAPALKTATNPHFRSRYADLSACVEAVIDALNANGIALLQETQPSDNGVTISTVLLHESGDRLTGGALHVPASKQDPQGYGSALTYARRYSLMSTCGIAPEDDDGNTASAPAPKQASKPAPTVADKLAAAKDLSSLATIWKGLSVAEKKAGETAKEKLKEKFSGTATPKVTLEKPDALDADRMKLRELLDSTDYNHGQFVEDMVESDRCRKKCGKIDDLNAEELKTAIAWREEALA